MYTCNNLEFKMHHIAYATKSTDDSFEVFKSICPKIITYRKFEKSQNVFYTYITNTSEDHIIELIEPAKGPSPVNKLLNNQDCVIYHICYEVNNFEEGKEYLKKRGFFMTTKPFIPDFEPDKIVCHFYNPFSGVIEILSKIDNNK